jgi:hypothetical protein
MPTSDLPEILDEMHAYIRRDVASGFEAPDDIIEGVIELLGDDYDPDSLRPHAERMTRELFELHHHEQMSWPSITDCDRLDQAFAYLESNGIVSRQHFSCCGTCGSGEIHTEMANITAKGHHVRGYTFYHVQDTESAVEGGGLYLSYGANVPEPEAAIEIGQEIVAALHAHGLATKWDGTWNYRIFVTLDWKRRYTSF